MGVRREMNGAKGNLHVKLAMARGNDLQTAHSRSAFGAAPSL